MKTPLPLLSKELKTFSYWPPGTTIKHRATGGQYVIRGYCFLESSMEPHFTYSPVSHPEVAFCRPTDELTPSRWSFPSD